MAHKELTIEEKAKAYDEAVKKVNELQFGKCNKTFKYTSELYEYLFPQLIKESEDVRMVKSFKRLVEAFYEVNFPTQEGFTRKDMIAWLDKQGEHAKFRNSIQVGDKVTRNDNGELVNLTQLQRVAKPETKKKHRFKEGDWVVYDNKITCHIDSVYQGSHSLMYTVTDDSNTTCSFSVSGFERHSRLWTIQDAKAGDVLATLDYIFIFKELLNGDGGVSYCNYDYTAYKPLFYWFEDRNWYFGEKAIVHPATKEQRDLLFQKMKEAGYDWDANKKELKRIDEMVGKGNEKEIPNTEWSEEDSKMINEIRLAIARYANNEGERLKMVRWLDAHCNAYPVPDKLFSHWKPTKEQMQRLNFAIIEYLSGETKRVVESIYNELKKL